MKDGKRPPGRPRISDTAERIEQTRLIGMAVYKLMYWARGSQREICEAVGKAAKTVLSRADTYGIALGSERIKDFYEGWVNEENQWREKKGWGLLPRIGDHTKKSRYAGAPNKVDSLELLAEQLLRNKGSPPPIPKKKSTY